MSASYTKLGPGTVKVGPDATGVDFSCEVVGATITHEYAEGESRTMLCGDVRGGDGKRTDGFTADLENDLTAKGLYAFLHAHDLEVVSFTFTPNTADAATWAGKVTLKLPSEVGADEFGAPIASSIEWAAADTGVFTFTPAATPTVAQPAGTDATAGVSS